MKPLRIALRQIRGGSGVDVWAESFCRGLWKAGQECSLDLLSPVYQVAPSIASLSRSPFRSDIVHGNSWNGFAFRQECPLVVTEHLVVHDPALAPYKTPAQKLYHRWIYRCERKSFEAADAIVSVSRYTRQKAEELFGLSDTIMIYNGIDASLYQPRETSRASWGIPEDRCVLLYTGNLSRRKGSDLLLPIMKQLGGRFLLLTTSGNRKTVQTTLPFSRNIGYLDPEQLVQAYNMCDVFIIPSRMEGLSLSALEAMSCARPVIAFDCSSFPELVVDGKGGFLCRFENVKECAERIRYLAEEPELARRMGAFNRGQVLEKFTLEDMVRNYLRLYRSL